MSEIKDIALWESGERKIQWVKGNMPLLRGIEAEFAKTKPFAGKRIALSIHLEAKTAYLCRVLAAGGAEMYITGSNPLSTQDDIAAALVHNRLNVYAWHGVTPEEYEAHTRRVIEAQPHFIIDDGGDLVTLIHKEYDEAFSTARLLAKTEGIFAGSSSGAAMAAVLKLTERVGGGNIVTVFPDRGDRYFSTGLFG